MTSPPLQSTVRLPFLSSSATGLLVNNETLKKLSVLRTVITDSSVNRVRSKRGSLCHASQARPPALPKPVRPLPAPITRITPQLGGQSDSSQPLLTTGRPQGWQDQAPGHTQQASHPPAPCTTITTALYLAALGDHSRDPTPAWDTCPSLPLITIIP